MDLITREHYLGQLERYVQTPTTVAVVGLRRVGKSVLLRQLAERLEDRGTVVYVDKEDLAFDQIATDHDLASHVADLRAHGPTYVIVDEVQLIERWERAVASLQNREDTHVVIAGSNATLFAGGLASRLAGRYVTVRVLPLSLGEFEHLYGAIHGAGPDDRSLFERFRRMGGLPGLLHTDLADDVTAQMQQDIYSTIALRDIVARHGIRDVGSLEAVTRFAMDNVGNLTTAKRIADYSRGHGRTLSVDSVVNYLTYLCDAFVLDRVDRYDVRGKRFLQVNAKYYLGDLGLRTGMLGFSDRWIGGDLENLVYHELLRRGFRVSVGVVDEGEVDFVADGSGGRVYVQVAYLLTDPKTLEREKASLLRVEDAYPKIIVSMDTVSPGDLSGIRHISGEELLRGAPLA